MMDGAFYLKESASSCGKYVGSFNVASMVCRSVDLRLNVSEPDLIHLWNIVHSCLLCLSLLVFYSPPSLSHVIKLALLSAKTEAADTSVRCHRWNTTIPLTKILNRWCSVHDSSESNPDRSTLQWLIAHDCSHLRKVHAVQKNMSIQKPLKRFRAIVRSCFLALGYGIVQSLFGPSPSSVPPSELWVYPTYPGANM